MGGRFPARERAAPDALQTLGKALADLIAGADTLQADARQGLPGKTNFWGESNA
jgi:hypothetical protein